MHSAVYYYRLHITAAVALELLMLLLVKCLGSCICRFTFSILHHESSQPKQISSRKS